MSWFQRIASVTFSLEGSHKISQPKDILSLSNELRETAARKFNSHVGYNIITPDGDDFDKMTGTINWYVTDKVPEDQQRQIMQQWIQEMEIMDFQMKATGPEMSNLNRFNEPGSETLMVYRIHVLKNGSENYAQVPEINISNFNAQSFLESLGIPFDQCGSIDLNELRTKLDMFTPWDQQELIKEPEQGGGEGQVTWFEGGRTENQVDYYITTLKQIVDFGLQNGFQMMTWC